MRSHLPSPGCPRAGFPDSSVGRESACNAGDPGSIPGSGRSTGEEIGYPLQYSRASLVAQLVKNLPAVQETWVQSLGCQDPLEKVQATAAAAKSLQSCPTLCDLVDYTVRGILQTRMLEWVAFPFSRGSSQPRDRTRVSCITGGFFTS